MQKYVIFVKPDDGNRNAISFSSLLLCTLMIFFVSRIYYTDERYDIFVFLFIYLLRLRLDVLATIFHIRGPKILLTKSIRGIFFPRRGMSNIPRATRRLK